jgi:hypothetical protein
MLLEIKNQIIIRKDKVIKIYGKGAEKWEK